MTDNRSCLPLRATKPEINNNKRRSTMTPQNFKNWRTLALTIGLSITTGALVAAVGEQDAAKLGKELTTMTPLLAVSAIPAWGPTTARRVFANSHTPKRFSSGIDFSPSACFIHLTAMLFSAWRFVCFWARPIPSFNRSC
jgi:hypothetical protein